MGFKMFYIDAIKLLNTCVKNNILHEDGGNIAVYKDSSNNSKEGWYLIPKDILAKKLMEDKDGQTQLIAALNKANVNFEPDYPVKDSKSPETYIAIWYEEEEEWYYFKELFDETLFPHGYTDYEIVVENGYIVSDTYNRDNKGKLFKEAYDTSLWDNIK